MSCKLLFIRHGQSLGNLAEKFLGHTDLDLSELGYRQAKGTAEYLMSISIDKVYSSDLLRAYSTCNQYLELSGHTAEKDKNLREIYVGNWEGKSFAYLKENSPQYKIWLNDLGSACPEGGESVVELSKRAVKTITEIAEKNDGKTVAIFTHATLIRAFFNFAYGNDVSGIKNLKWAANASVSTALYENGKFEVVEYGNDSFLADLKTDLPTNV